MFSRSCFVFSSGNILTQHLNCKKLNKVLFITCKMISIGMQSRVICNLKIRSGR